MNGHFCNDIRAVKVKLKQSLNYAVSDKNGRVTLRVANKLPPGTPSDLHISHHNYEKGPKINATLIPRN